MATCLEIIEGAALELGARTLGDTLGNTEADRGLVILQTMYREAVDKGVFGRVEDHLATGAYEAEEQQRVYSAGYTITIPTEVDDAYTGETRRPLDLSMIQVVNDGADPQISIYDAHIGDWVRIDGLTLAGEAPFSARSRHGLECALARRLAGTFRKPVPDSTASYAAGLASIFSSHLSAPRTTTATEYY